MLGRKIICEKWYHVNLVVRYEYVPVCYCPGPSGGYPPIWPKQTVEWSSVVLCVFLCGFRLQWRNPTKWPKASFVHYAWKIWERWRTCSRILARFIPATKIQLKFIISKECWGKRRERSWENLTMALKPWRGKGGNKRKHQQLEEICIFLTGNIKRLVNYTNV